MMQDVNGLSVMQGYPVVREFPIQWGDLDAYGHVNNLVYLKWFEAVRAAYAGEVGVDLLPRPSGIGALLASLSCKYLRPASFPGFVVVGVRVSKMSIGSITLHFRVADKRIGVPVAEGDCDAVLYDYTDGKPIPVPDTIRAAVERLEGRSFAS